MPEKLFLLDAMALIYRAHFALNKVPRNNTGNAGGGFINSKGMNTGAAYGFTNTLLDIFNKENPAYIAVVFDAEGPTFRHEGYEDYKANRQEQPEEITSNLPYIKQLLEGFHIPILEIPGYEADDIIGTLAKKWAGHELDVYMMTSDKDYCQLVDDHIYIYKPAFMGRPPEVWDHQKVKEKFGVEEMDQVRDILGLWGDSVDNIPGIPGIGEKTAKKLITEFHSIENLLNNTDQLKGKQKENVEAYGEQSLQSKALATIYTEVPVEASLAELKVREPDQEALSKLFDELEFRTIKKKVLGIEPGAKPDQQLDMFSQPPEKAGNTKEDEDRAADAGDTQFNTIENTPHQYDLIDDEKALKTLTKKLMQQKEFCLDTETSSVHAMEARLIGISFSFEQGAGYYVPVPEDESGRKNIIYILKEVFENEQICKIGHNIKYDIIVLQNHGAILKGPVFDTMLGHYLIEPDMRHNMDLLATTYLNYKPISISSLIGEKGKNQGVMSDVSIEKITEYAAEDADITFQLKHVINKKINELKLTKLFHETENALVPVLADMEITGVKVDEQALNEISEDLAETMQNIEQKIYEMAGTRFNIGSPKQLGEVLFDKLKLVEKPKKTASGQYATGEQILTSLAAKHEIASQILEFREVQKLKNTYVDALPELINKYTGKLHTSFNQAVAATGRLSSTHPNLQNIPVRTDKGRKIRKAFVPGNENALILSADYSQIELRIMAAFANDETMIHAFESGRDIHATTAAKVFKVPEEEITAEMRRKAKMVNFGIIYGISAYGLGQRLGIPRKEAQEIIDAYFTEFPAIKEYMDKVVEEAREKEYVATILGRRRYVHEINSRNQNQRSFAERNAINAPIQGTAADMIKMAMINIHKWMEQEQLKSKMILQVHDELLFDADQDELAYIKPVIRDYMQNAIPLKVKMEIGMGEGSSWLEAH